LIDVNGVMRRTSSGVPAAASLEDLISLRRTAMERLASLLWSESPERFSAGDPGTAAAAEAFYEEWCALAPAHDSGFASDAVVALLHQLYDVDHAILSLTDGEPI
jgi:hypothetical protein